jgi:hypothetical protein
MTYVILMAAAAVVYFWPQIAAKLQQLRAVGNLDQRQLFALALAVGCVVAFMAERMPDDAPTPAPPAPAAFSLRGRFIGPTASQDAAMFGALCEELAAVLEYDSMQHEPRIKTGAAVEDLRVAAREARLRGVSLGARQPHVRDAVKAFLDQAAGTSGGPLTPEQRSAWVSAFREVGRAATDASR